MKTINIKGKQYVQVNERIKEFRSDDKFKNWSLITKIVECDDKICLMQAIIEDPTGKIIATGTAFERANAEGSLVNKTSHVENCETSAWGRALGNLGIGIDASIASAEEVINAKLKQVDTENDYINEERTQPQALDKRKCAKCGAFFAPKFEWARDCLDCYKQSKSTTKMSAYAEPEGAF